MINVKNISLNFGARKLFENVNIKFLEGNCYGVIGANGAGKSTFLKIISGEMEASSGEIEISKGQRLAVLKQDHFQYQDFTVLDTVYMGHAQLYKIMKEREDIYSNENFSEEDGHRAAELEADFASLGGWEAETEAATLLNGLGIKEEMLQTKMALLKDADKIKVLLAQALFAKPENLLLDEPTNHLDDASIRWLEDYLLNFPNTVIVISHDRHFLNKICTHMVDIDYGKAQVYVGNYDFWVQSSQLARELKANENKKKEDKAKDLEAFIRRFSANASKSAQATSRRKQLENLRLEELPSSSRKSPSIIFHPKREAGDQLLEVKNLSKSIDGQLILSNISFTINKGDKAIFIGENEVAKTLLFKILMGEVEPDEGSYKWGITTTQAYLPKDNSHCFSHKDVNLIDWLREYSEEKSENFIRSFLGRMLFSGEETLKSSSVLSGGEKVRCMLAKMMLQGPNVLVMDEPTSHLDLESINALNDGVQAFSGTILFTTHDRHLAQTVSTRLFEFKGQQLIDHQRSYRELYEQNSI